MSELLVYGASVNRARRSDGTTPLLMASLKGSVRCVRLLLEYHADVNRHSKEVYRILPVSPLQRR
eukprot:m.51335 g.51335  ORF g.51335 m.51335 type:complete len:65 (-) comp48284_c0_seq9:886-1080(-)